MGKANTHLTHLEELVLTQGSQGYGMARAFLLELLETLKGNTNSSIQTSVKWDGAPAIFAGVNPDNGKFFVGTKSIFNKVPKINYTKEDVIKNHGHAPGLVDKLIKALRYLPSLGINNILQGDFMFDDEMLEVVDIDGEAHYRFKPNTIVYAVPVRSDLGEQIGKSKFGIVFHTTYESLDSGASFGADVSSLNEVPGVWYDDAFFTDDTGVVTLTGDEESEVVRLVDESESINQNINYNDLPAAFLNIYINSEIKSGSFLDDAEKSFDGFINWYSLRAQKKISNLKSDRGKQRASQNAQQTLQSFNNRKEDILNIFRVSRLLFEAKNIFIEKYNNAVYNTKHFVDDGSGDLVATNPEGYVAVDHRGNGIKFVDRLEFSRANFAIDKGDKFAGQVNEEGFKDDEYDSVPNPPTIPVLGEDPIEIDLDIEDEDDDPVEDEDYSNIIADVAVVPGAFKPPHKGHLDMVRKYAEMAEKVIVLISKPTKNGRRLPDSPDGKPGREINADDSLQLWQILASDLPDDKVEIKISPTHASPINAAYEYVGEEGPLSPGTRVILGASTKDNDWRRWIGAEKYVKSGVELLDPEATAVEPTLRPSNEAYSATAFREALADPANNREEIADFVGKENVDNVLKVLGMSSELSEMSSGGAAGAGTHGIEGGVSPVPLGSGSDKPAKKKKPKKKAVTVMKDENLDIVNEVMRLIKERGILR